MELSRSSTAVVFMFTLITIFAAVQCKLLHPPAYFDALRPTISSPSSPPSQSPIVAAGVPVPSSLSPATGSAGRSTSGTTGCTDLIIGMIDCLSYLRADGNSNDPKPDGSCCSGFKTLINKQESCICYALKHRDDLGIELNITRALSLPSVCGVRTPPLTNCGVPLAPTGSTPAVEIPDLSPATSPQIPIIQTPSTAPSSSISESPEASAYAPSTSSARSPSIAATPEYTDEYPFCPSPSPDSGIDVGVAAEALGPISSAHPDARFSLVVLLSVGVGAIFAAYIFY